MAKKHNAPAKPALEPNEALFQAVSLCRKAGALTMGFDAVEDAVVKGKAWLVNVYIFCRKGKQIDHQVDGSMEEVICQFA